MQSLLLAALVFTTGTAAATAADDGFVPLFNGRDLAGWVNVNCAPETWSARDGMIHCTGLPTGALRTPRQYENFILELEWRHLSRSGNSGVFIWGTPMAAPGVPFLRGIEVQVLDHGYAEDYEKQTGKKSEWFTTHGDVFPIHGASMKPFGRHNGERSFPSEERSKGTPEWNHYRIVCTNGVLRLSVNGKEVSGGEDCNYRKGYLGLESEGGPIDFRNLRIKELPSSKPPPELAAPEASGLRPIFTGLDLRGWKTNAATAGRWEARGEHLVLRQGEANKEATLWSEREYGDAEFVLDCRLAKTAAGKPIVPPSLVLHGAELTLADASPDGFQRYRITVRGGAVVLYRGDKEANRLFLPATKTRAPLGLRDVGTAMQWLNLYAREL